MTCLLGYSIGDVSVVYPIGRGSAVAVTAVIEAFFLTSYFPGHAISYNGWIGANLLFLFAFFYFNVSLFPRARLSFWSGGIADLTLRASLLSLIFILR